MKYEILENNNVINIIMADATFMESQYQDGNYREVQYVEDLVVSTKITRLAFLNRFTDEEAINIDLASQGATIQAAAMRRYQKKVDAATFIDLSKEDTRAGVLMLETLGLLSIGRAIEILDAPARDEEKYLGI